MKVDVVIPTFNRLWALKRVLPFYLANPEVARVIVVDDHSSDGTGEWLAAEAWINPQLCVVTHDTNRGASAARNTGAAAASRPFVFFADDDMFLEPTNGLSVLVRDMERLSGDIIAPVFIYAENQSRPTVSPQPPGKTNMLSLCSKFILERKPLNELVVTLPDETFVTGQFPGVMLVRRKVLERVRYDEGLGLTSYRDETDFQLKALEAGYRLLACPRVSLVDMARTGNRGGCHSSTGIIGYEWRACQNNWRILRRHRRVISTQLGLRIPVEIMQLTFMLDHLCIRIPRYIVGNLLRRLGLRR